MLRTKVDLMLIVQTIFSVVTFHTCAVAVPTDATNVQSELISTERGAVFSSSGALSEHNKDPSATFQTLIQPFPHPLFSSGFIPPETTVDASLEMLIAVTVD